ncbi:hypothetical protein AG0111_0g9484 [Alternaria gaisen]|uniref:Uncharacterized protein n=1 Tax=Alternaria gaisen TaxID=167740 RepID=A0ACB6FBN9_9PLEO|nr:hypothetical protein AG0111_0g9484 [Alternaria gaisen]
MDSFPRPFHIAIKGRFIVGPELCSEGNSDQKYAMLGELGDKGSAATFTLRDGILCRGGEWAMGRPLAGPPPMIPMPAVWVRDLGSVHRMAVAPGPHGIAFVNEGSSFGMLEEAGPRVFSLPSHMQGGEDALQLHFVD